MKDGSAREPQVSVGPSTPCVVRPIGPDYGWAKAVLWFIVGAIGLAGLLGTSVMMIAFWPALVALVMAVAFARLSYSRARLMFNGTSLSYRNARGRVLDLGPGELDRVVLLSFGHAPPQRSLLLASESGRVIVTLTDRSWPVDRILAIVAQTQTPLLDESGQWTSIKELSTNYPGAFTWANRDPGLMFLAIAVVLYAVWASSTLT